MRPRLDLRHLEMMLAISEEGTLAEAAHVLRVTPSALSHRIREAERRLGMPLYQKRGRTLRPTLGAEILTSAAGRLLFDLVQSERLAVGSAEGVRHVIRLTVSVYNCFHWLPAFLAGLRGEHPDIDIDIEAGAVLNPYENLATELIDMVISPGVILPGTVDAVPLFNDELVAVTAPGHPFCDRDFVEADDFLLETNLTYSMVRQPGFEADRFWTPANVYPAREVKIGSVEAICELIKAGFGVSILSRWALKPHFEAGTLKATPLGRDGLDIVWNAVLRGAADENAPERKVARALAGWFVIHSATGRD
jgi:LysR family transcriptional regulator for metE and metH